MNNFIEFWLGVFCYNYDNITNFAILSLIIGDVILRNI